MPKTVLAKVYPNSRRPSMFKIVDGDDPRISSLTESYGYETVDTGKPDSYTEDDAWREYTTKDGDGFTQWR